MPIGHKSPSIWKTHHMTCSKLQRAVRLKWETADTNWVKLWLNPASIFNHLAKRNNISPTFGFPWNSPGFPFPFQKATFLGLRDQFSIQLLGFFHKDFFLQKAPLWWFGSPFWIHPICHGKKQGLQAKNAQGGNDLIWTTAEILKLTKWQIAGQPNDPTIHLKNLPKERNLEF